MGSMEKLIARSSVAFTMKSPADGGFLILPPPWNSTQPPVEVSTFEIFFELTSGGERGLPGIEPGFPAMQQVWQGRDHPRPEKGVRGGG